MGRLPPLGLCRHRVWPARDFVTAADCALLSLDMERYFVVTRFQSVAELDMLI
ncbi:MAG: hypothetical protein V9H25_22910 [Candidatus Competibacter sp.]